MKKLLSVIILIFVVCSFGGCGLNSNDVIRIHIRANSNSESDQNIKMCVKESVVAYITPLIADCEDSGEVRVVLEDNLDKITDIANDILMCAGFDYLCNAKICEEYFPTRSYGDATFSADYYDALIIELGSAKGDNWWCVAYPPLCFVGEGNDSDNIKYKSKLLELINKYLG